MRTRRPIGGRGIAVWRAALGAGAMVVVVAALAVVASVLGADGGEGPDAIAASFGRLGLPAFPGGAAFAATLPDGSRVGAWRTGPSTLRLRVDTSAARCSGGSWREWWHTAQLPRVRISAGGAFAAAGHGTPDPRPAAVHTATYSARGTLAGGVLRGTLVRADAYRGHVTGVCRRVVRFTAAASR